MRYKTNLHISIPIAPKTCRIPRVQEKNRPRVLWGNLGSSFFNRYFTRTSTVLSKCAEHTQGLAGNVGCFCALLRVWKLRMYPAGCSCLLRKCVWGMVWSVKYLLRRCLDPQGVCVCVIVCVYIIYMYNNIYWLVV